MGKTIFCRSVWSDDEDDVYLGNNPHYVVGLDAISDHIISVEFPDDDDDLFEASKFINLNQGPEPDMGLNFQSRQT